MDKSDQIRLKDLRGAYRLLGECRELGYDADGWRLHMLEGLRAMTGAQAAMHMQIQGLETDDERIESPLVCGLFDARQQALWAHYQRERVYRDDAFHLGYFRAFNGSLRSRSLEAVVDMRQWRMSRHYNDYLRPCGLDDRITSAVSIPGDRPSTARVLVLHRAAADGRFSRRSLRLVHLFHHELVTLLSARRPPVEVPDGTSLTPQLRRVLAYALRGESEKRIANRLGISRHTVNRHLQRLYQQFGVRSRGQLMYRCRDSLPMLWRLDEDE